MKSVAGMPPIESIAGGIRLRVRVQPRARRSRIDGLLGDRLKLLLKAPPVDGKANAECIRLLASELSVRRSQIEILSGEKAREKLVQVSGITVEAARQALGLLPLSEPDHG